MDNDTRTPAWMKDELVKDIPAQKLDLLRQIFEDASRRVNQAGPGKSRNEMLMTLMPILQRAKQSNLSFSPAEIQAAVTAIRKYSTAQELQQIDKIYPQK